MLDRIMQRLESFRGTWAGSGKGGYPTVASFEYEERLRFEVDPSYPLIRYEQRTWLLPSREPSHWECVHPAVRGRQRGPRSRPQAGPFPARAHATW